MNEQNTANKLWNKTKNNIFKFLDFTATQALSSFHVTDMAVQILKTIPIRCKDIINEWCDSSEVKACPANAMATLRQIWQRYQTEPSEEENQDSALLISFVYQCSTSQYPNFTEDFIFSIQQLRLGDFLYISESCCLSIGGLSAKIKDAKEPEIEAEILFLEYSDIQSVTANSRKVVITLKSPFHPCVGKLFGDNNFKESKDCIFEFKNNALARKFCNSINAVKKNTSDHVKKQNISREGPLQVDRVKPKVNLVEEVESWLIHSELVKSAENFQEKNIIHETCQAPGDMNTSSSNKRKRDAEHISLRMEQTPHYNTESRPTPDSFKIKQRSESDFDSELSSPAPKTLDFLCEEPDSDGCKQLAFNAFLDDSFERDSAHFVAENNDTSILSSKSTVIVGMTPIDRDCHATEPETELFEDPQMNAQICGLKQHWRKFEQNKLAEYDKFKKQSNSFVHEKVLGLAKGSKFQLENISKKLSNLRTRYVQQTANLQKRISEKRVNFRKGLRTIENKIKSNELASLVHELKRSIKNKASDLPPRVQKFGTWQENEGNRLKEKISKEQNTSSSNIKELQGLLNSLFTV